MENGPTCCNFAPCVLEHRLEQFVDACLEPLQLALRHNQVMDGRKQNKVHHISQPIHGEACLCEKQLVRQDLQDTVASVVFDILFCVLEFVIGEILHRHHKIQK